MASVYFDPAVGGDGSIVTDDSNPSTGLANGGHRTRFVPSLGQTVSVASFIVTKTAEAAASAASALNAPGTSATSTSSLTIGSGSKTITIQTGKAFSIGQYVVIANTSAPANYVAGQITAHNSGTGSLTINATETSGSGTYTDWTIALSAPGGVTLTGVQSLSNKTMVGVKEARTAVGASDLDLSVANFFTKTISGTTTFTVSNVPTSGTAASFVIDLTNGGSASINWWTGTKWANGIAPTLTVTGRDVLGFFTHDGGTTWTGLVLAKDAK